MKFKFKLKNPEASKPTSIQLRCFKNGKRFIYSLGNDRLINPKEWNFENERPYDEKSNVAVRIDNVISKIEKYDALKEIQGEPWDFNELRSALDKLSDVKGVKAADIKNEFENEFEPFFSRYIDDMKAGVRLTESEKLYHKDSIKAYNAAFGLLKKYKKERKIKHLLFRHFDKNLYKDLGAFMDSKNYTLNYFGNVIKSLKRILKVAYDEGYHNNTSYLQYKKVSEPVDHIALTQDEVQIIYKYDLTDKKHLELSRDIFCLQCVTGLRVSDVLRIKPEYIKNDGADRYIEMRTKKKPHTFVSIPVGDIAGEILERYNFEIPKTYDQKINDQIKEVAKLAGITDNEEIEKSKGRKSIIANKKRYELISTHTGRRTALTNMRRAKMSLDAIQKISGHSTIKMLERYLKIDSSESARIVASNKFFKSNSHLKRVN